MGARTHSVRPLIIASGIALLLMTVSGPVSAGTTGTLSGRVIDPEKNPVPVAMVVIPGVRATYADKDGRYSLVNIPPGTYEVKVSRIGYQTVAVQDVIISADQTTTLDVEIEEAPIQMEEVVVKAERPPVDLNITSTRFTLKSADIEALPVQELDDVVNLQAGVVDGHFRGGRLGEVQYQVDGVSVNNAFDNKSSLKVDRSLLQEVQVISGTFDAEYGQAMSGVVNAVLKEGTKTFQWSAEAFAGGFFFPGREGGRLTSDEVHPGAIQNYQLTLSGPTPLPKTVFLASGRRYIFDDYIYGTRTFVPTDSADFENRIYNPTGDGKEVPLGYTREWSGIAKLTNTSIPNLKLSYSAIFNHIKGRRSDYAYRLNPDGLSKQQTVAVSHGLDWTHTLSTSTFLDLSLRQTLFKYEDFVFEDVFDTRYDEAGPAIGDINYEDGAITQGVQFTRYRQKTNSYLVKSALVSQVTPEHQVKVGGEFHFPEVEFGTPGHLTFATVEGVEALVRHVDSPPDFPGPRTYHPLVAAAFLQDQINWSDLTVRAGLRLDYFDARSTVPSDLANPANSIAGAPESVPVSTSKKFSASPRLGVAYPIQDRASIHFAYGHFRQFPPIGEMFNNADYAVLANLQAGGISFGVLGNPDVKPEKTVQYEIGYKHALTDDLGLDVTVFYKDIRDLLGVEFITTYNNAEYARLTNVDFGNVLGFTFALDQRQLGPASISLDYTWQQALGNASNPRETATRAEAGEDPRPRLVPFNWDQRHTFNMTVSLYQPGSHSVSAVLRLASGQPYTPVLEAGFGQGLETNSGRKPAGAVLDLRAEQSLGEQWGANANLFGRVFNLFDARYFNGPVFNSTGSAFYSRFPEADRVGLADPGRFYPPRKVEIGIRLTSD